MKLRLYHHLREGVVYTHFCDRQEIATNVCCYNYNNNNNNNNNNKDDNNNENNLVT